MPKRRFVRRATLFAIALPVLGAIATPTGAGAVASSRSSSSAPAQMPIVDITQSTSTMSSGPRRFSYDNESIYWSVTATRRLSAGLNSIHLYPDSTYANPLTVSNLGGPAVDFVVVDSNHAPLGTWYPKVVGPVGFVVQNDTDAELVLCPGSLTQTIDPGSIVEATDIFPPSGSAYTISITGGPAASAAFLMTSDADDPSTWYQSRNDGTAFTGSGANLSLTVQGDDDWHGLVITDQSRRGGTYTISC